MIYYVRNNGEKIRIKNFVCPQLQPLQVFTPLYSVQIIQYVDGNLESHEDDLTDEYGDIRIDLADTVGIDHTYVVLSQTPMKMKTPLKKRG